MARSASTPVGRNAQLARVLNILRDLERLDGVDVYELAERYATSVRTIRRDFEALQEVGLPLREEFDGTRKRWRLDVQRGPRAMLDVSHYLALKVATAHAGPARRMSALFGTLEDLADKIEQAVGAKGRARLASIEAAFYSYEKFAYAHAPADVLWGLVEAIAERRVCEVHYRAPGQPTAKQFEVLPLRLFIHHGAAYLMAHVAKHDDQVSLNLQRLTQLKVLEKRADPPADFDARHLEDTAFGVFTSGPPTRYVLLFSPEVAPYIRERIWHPSQELAEMPEGSVRLTFTCAASPEVTGWVASWRKGVQVESPEVLRAELRSFGAWCATTYAE